MGGTGAMGEAGTGNGRGFMVWRQAAGRCLQSGVLEVGDWCGCSALDNGGRRGRVGEADFHSWQHSEFSLLVRE